MRTHARQGMNFPNTHTHMHTQTNMRTHAHTCAYMHAHAHTCNQSSSSNWFVEGCRSWSVPKMSPGLSFPRRVAVLLEVDTTPTHTRPRTSSWQKRIPPFSPLGPNSRVTALSLPNAATIFISCHTTHTTTMTVEQNKYCTLIMLDHTRIDAKVRPRI